MSDMGTIIDPGTLRFERLLPGPIERVWAYLTESDKRATWLASGEMELRPGGRVELFFRHADLSPVHEPVPEKYKRYENGSGFKGEILRCEPPHLLSHSWADGSQVTYELTEQDAKVLLVLTHRRIATPEEIVTFAGGWHTHLGIMVDRLNERVPQPFWSTHARLEGIYESQIAAR